MRKLLLLLFPVILLAQIPAGFNNPTTSQNLFLPGNTMPSFTWNNQASWVGFSGKYYDGMAISNSEPEQVNGRQYSYTCPYEVTARVNLTQEFYANYDARVAFYFADSSGKLVVMWYVPGNGSLGFDKWSSPSTFAATFSTQINNIVSYGSGFITVKMTDDCTNLTWFVCTDIHVCNYQVATYPDNEYLSTPSLIGYGGYSGNGAAQLMIDVENWNIGSYWTSPSGNYALASFQGKNAQDTLQMFFSSDSVNWTQSSVSYGNATGNLRDPSIAKIGSKYFLAHTCNDGPYGGIVATAQWCFSSSSNLQSWANVSTISTSSYSGTLFDWAPEWVKNANNTIYLDGSSCPHLVMTSTDGASTYTIIEQHPTSNCSDPSMSGTTWSTPVALTAMDSFMLDPFISYDGTHFNFFYVDLVSPNESIQWGQGSTLTGTYTKQSSGSNWTGFQNGNMIIQEGPALLCLTYSGTFPSGSCSQWQITFDQVGASGGGNITDGQLFYSRSTALGSGWSTATNINTPVQAKHGTIIPYP